MFLSYFRDLVIVFESEENSTCGVNMTGRDTLVPIFYC